MTKADTISDKLAEFVESMSYKDIPGSIVEKAKLVILDTIGCIIAGATADKAKRLAGYFSSISAEGKATLFGSAKRCSPEAAAFANGTFAHILEYDDGHRPSDNHLACVVAPAVLAVCEAEGKSGKDFLTAFVLGYEIMGRVGRAVVLPRMEQHFHGTGTTGTFGAAAAAGKLLGLTRDQLADSLGIAGTASAGLKEVILSGFDCKSLHAGRAASNGVMAAYLARIGIEGPEQILEGEHGFCRGVTPGYTFEPILDGLSRTWELTYAGFKVHSTCGITFTAVDCVLDIVNENHLSPSEIAGMKVGVPTRILNAPQFNKRMPASTGEARFSVVYACVAAALHGQVGMAEIDMRQIQLEGTRKLLEKTTMVRDLEAEEVDSRDKDKPMFFPPASIDITTRDGRHFRRFRASPVGYDPIGSPMTPAQVEDKFHMLAGLGIDAKRQKAIVDVIAHLEEFKDIEVLRANFS
ncbi:MAG: MmgE/PrpD family protein [Chloroflexi bacterium]|nr:MmgE/PrpD family protein [Chloroflexota bacterium]